MKPAIYPVIHHLNDDLTVKQAVLAEKHGANGVFLISHKGEDDQIIALTMRVRQAFRLPRTRLGINLLSRSPMEALDAARRSGGLVDMVWADNMGVSSRGLTAAGEALATASRLHVSMFASVAFKYQPVESNPALAAKNAAAAGFIPTTSGVATGNAPELNKIVAMSRAVNGRLAVASGMTPLNVGQYAPYLSAILVSTGISKDEFRIDPAQLTAFLKAASVPAAQEDMT